MEKVSEYISKKVISLEKANQVGYVINVMFDEDIKNFTGLVVVDEESEDCYILSKEDIYSIGEDCIMIASSKVLQFKLITSSNSPIGKLVYDVHGNKLGRVIEVLLQGKQVRKIITDKCEFPQKYIKKSGDNFIIFGVKKSKNQKSSFKDEVGEINERDLPNVTISVENNDIKKYPIINEGPIKLFATPKILLGKKVKCDIFGYNNELIAQKNQIVDQKIINKAKLHNKLNFLNYYSD